MITIAFVCRYEDIIQVHTYDWPHTDVTLTCEDCGWSVTARLRPHWHVHANELFEAVELARLHACPTRVGE